MLSKALSKWSDLPASIKVIALVTLVVGAIFTVSVMDDDCPDGQVIDMGTPVYVIVDVDHGIMVPTYPFAQCVPKGGPHE